MPSEKTDVLVHPQSVVHGMVEFRDGSVVAQLGAPDMRIPIAHCLAWPDRMAAPNPRLDLTQIATLTFEPPDLARFPALRLAREALQAGQAAPTILNAANEVAVGEFIAGRLAFAGIPALVETALELGARHHLMAEPPSIDAAIAVDHVTRRLVREVLPGSAARANE
jgi:1-deoxy-D-xylulose-5-phosphate reductoisomerase